MFVLSRFPFPLEKGDKLRAYYQLIELSRKHEIYLFAVSDLKVKEEWLDELRPYCKEIRVVYLSKLRIGLNLLRSLFNRLPFQVNYFFSRSVKRELDDFMRRVAPEGIFCQLIRMAEYVREIRTTRKVLDYMDTFSIGMIRRKADTGFPKRLLVSWEAERLRKYEREIFDDFEELIPIPDHGLPVVVYLFYISGSLISLPPFIPLLLRFF